MVMYAVHLNEITRAQKSPAARPLIETALEGRDRPEVCTINGTDAVVLDGPESTVLALVRGLVEQGFRVLERGDANTRWATVKEAPHVEDEPDDSEEFIDADDGPEIDPEFEALCGGRTPEEEASLRASLVKEGCRDNLTVWAEKDILLDGHGRRALCIELGIRFGIDELSFATRQEARNWIIENALARRSLTRLQRDYLIGKRFNVEKKDPAETRNVGLDSPLGQSDPAGPTRDRIAAQVGVSAKTVQRAAAYAQAVDSITETAGPSVRTAILSGKVKLTRDQVTRAVEQHVTTLEELRAVKRLQCVAVQHVPRVTGLARQLDKVLAAYAPSATVADVPELSALWKLEESISALRLALPFTAPVVEHA